MQQKRRCKRKKLKPKIGIFIFVLLSLFIIHTGNNLLKLFHVNKNEISDKTSTQVENKSENIDHSSIFFERSVWCSSLCKIDRHKYITKN